MWEVFVRRFAPVLDIASHRFCVKEFVKEAPRWVHVDFMGYTAGGYTKPGRPEGGEVMSLRALAHFLFKRYSSK